MLLLLDMTSASRTEHQAFGCEYQAVLGWTPWVVSWSARCSTAGSYVTSHVIEDSSHDDRMHATAYSRAVIPKTIKWAPHCLQSKLKMKGDLHG